MTLYQFRLLSEDKQIEHLYKNGVYIGKRRDKNASIILYQLDSFYIEISYHKYRNVISRIHCFTSIEDLDPYLEQVDVEGLFYSLNCN